MSKKIEFEIDGVKFKGRHLDPFVALDTFAILSPCIGEVLKDLDPELAKTDKMAMLAGIVQGALGSFRDLPKLVPAFSEAYQVQVKRNDSIGWMPLVDEMEYAFTGKTGLMVAWLIAAVREEYFDFLAGSGSTILRDLGGVCGFQIGLKDTGSAGE